jgi:hypothetical protein
MRRDEYEKRKQQIEEQHQAAVELLDAARRQQLRALDLVFFMAAGGEGAPAPSVPERAASAASALAESADNEAAAAVRPKRRAAWQLVEEIEAAMPKLPERFDRNDLCRALGEEPDRGSLYRSLQQLVNEGALTIEFHSSGKRPTRYRKALPSPQGPENTQEGR